MATTHLPPRDCGVVFADSDSDFTSGTYSEILRVQTASVTARQNIDDVREIGSTDFWSFYNDPTVDVTIDRNCIGDSAVQEALNSSYVAGTSTLADLVFDSSGDLITKEIYVVGGDTYDLENSEVIFGASSCYLSGVDFNFDVGGMATESWRFEASDMTDSTALADPGTPSVVTSLNPASGYGGIRHSDVSVKIATTGANAIEYRVQSVRFSATIDRTPLTELRSLTDGGYVGPFVRIANLPIVVTAAIELWPSENADQIFTQLGSVNNPTKIGDSNAAVWLKVYNGGSDKVYQLNPCIMEDISFNADTTTGGAISLTVRAYDMYL